MHAFYKWLPTPSKASAKVIGCFLFVVPSLQKINAMHVLIAYAVKQAARTMFATMPAIVHDIVWFTLDYATFHHGKG